MSERSNQALIANHVGVNEVGNVSSQGDHQK